MEEKPRWDGNTWRESEREYVSVCPSERQCAQERETFCKHAARSQIRGQRENFPALIISLRNGGEKKVSDCAETKIGTQEEMGWMDTLTDSYIDGEDREKQS